MSCEIKSPAELPVMPLSPGNDYKDRLVKLIPTEIITAYVPLKGLISGAGVSGNKQLLLWVIFGILVILNRPYLYHITGVRKAGQIVFFSFAFVLLLMVIGGTFRRIKSLKPDTFRFTKESFFMPAFYHQFAI